MTGATRPRLLVLLLALLTAVLLVGGSPAARAAPGDAGEARLYFFWGDGCPHCAEAKPVLAQWKQQYPGLTVVEREVWNNAANREAFAQMAVRHGFQATGVPTFFLGDRHWVGWSPAIGGQLQEAVRQCLASGCRDAADAAAPTAAPATPPVVPTALPTTPVPPRAADAAVLEVPLLGQVELASLSLPVTTLLIAAVDGFNPCSLWVLGVLLALALRTGSRRTTLIVGLVFITVTALVYALFIAGIFTIVSIAAWAPWLRVLVALVAVAFAAINIKDYFWFKAGVSLSIPESAKPGIYRRMRGVLANADNLPALVAGTVVLAAGVSIVELACTAGFPIVWTNILSERGVSAAAFVGLLVLYMLVYQLDELVIFGTAVVTLRASKLQERQGRVLKLAGGMLMLSLGVVMLVDPALMGSLGSSLLVFAAALAATALVLLVHRVGTRARKVRAR